MTPILKTPEAARQLIADKTREKYAAQCGISLKQVCEGYAQNAKNAGIMLGRAMKSKTGKYNGFTAEELKADQVYYNILAELPADYIYEIPKTIESANYFSEVLDLLGLKGSKLSEFTRIVMHDGRHRIEDSIKAKELLGDNFDKFITWFRKKRY